MAVTSGLLVYRFNTNGFWRNATSSVKIKAAEPVVIHFSVAYFACRSRAKGGGKC